MIITSVRLKNIKSYGEGADGDGVTVNFQPGVNRIAGLNGHGKTTLIECIGYALFLTDPSFIENFRMETYFLSYGAKAGEIDVSFNIDCENYRIERGIGSQNKRRPKVIQLSDGSICAEGEKEVSEYLCRLLALSDPKRLSEMFSKLIGVKQGRLPWPFDSTPTQAKAFFEPLLEVEVFRQCFDKLKPVYDQFKQERDEVRIQKAGVEERIRERSDSADKLASAKNKVNDLTDTASRNRIALDESLKEMQRQEGLERTYNGAKVEKDTAETALSTATRGREEAEKQVKESETAAATLNQTKAAYDAYAQAEAALVELDRKRNERDALATKRIGAETDRQDRAAKAQASRELAAQSAEQKRFKDEDLTEKKRNADDIHEKLESEKEQFESSQRSAEIASEDRATVNAWVQGLSDRLKRLRNTASAVAGSDAELTTWDPANLEAARNAEKAASDALTEARRLLAEARERKKTLADQLEKIKGGTCPFLKESCHQFDPIKVQSDLTGLDEEISGLIKSEKNATDVHKQAEEILTPLVTANNQLTSKREQMATHLNTYDVELRAFYPANVFDSIAGIKTWEETVPDLPAMVPIPKAALLPADVKMLQLAITPFSVNVDAWWGKAEQIIKTHLEHTDREKRERFARSTEFSGMTKQIAEITREIEGLAGNIKGKEQAAASFEEEAKIYNALVDKYDEQLKSYASLDGEIESTIKRRSENKEGHDNHLTSKTLADELEARLKKQQVSRDEEKNAVERLARAEEALKTATEAFKIENLTVARTEYSAKLAAATEAETNLTHATKELETQQGRFKEWEGACQELANIEQNISRIEAAMELTDLARNTLRDAAPAVAQHICDQIAVRAQVIFNRINPDPVELKWSADNYSLRITPGDRRFAMMSGGEQTKLALSMTLAMVEEFSKLRFCIFDEPTYGVDADSRGKLADAIIEVQKAAGLDQLLLVSHDDAFEGKIEHTILLRKSAASGTAIILTQ